LHLNNKTTNNVNALKLISTFSLLALLPALNSCNKDAGSGNSIQEIPAEGSISAIIRHPVSANGNIDTVNVAKMEFDHTEFDFGEVKEGNLVRHAFKFKNQGKVPLVINNTQSTCGCTVSQWPREPVPPGGENQISVEFNTAGKTDFQEKAITISANTYPSNTTIYLRGYVNPSDAN
jgi:hypothetical protein